MGKRTGPLCIFLAAALFSLGGVGFKMIPWSAMAINGGRNLISACVLAAYMAFTRHRLRFNRTVLLGAACTCSTTVLYALANKLTTAANTILLQFTAPAFVILFMWLIARQRPARRDVVACGCVFVGIICFVLDSLESGGMLGNLLALVSGATYAGVFMMGSFRDSDPVSSCVIGQSVSAMIGLPFLLQETDFSFTPVCALVLMGLFQVGIAYVLFSIGLTTTKPVTAVLISGIEPILNPIFTAIFCHERIGRYALAGGAIVFLTILVYNLLQARALSPGRSESA